MANNSWDQDAEVPAQPPNGGSEADTTTKLTPNQIAAWQALPDNQKSAIREREALRIFNLGLEHHRQGELPAAIEVYGKALILDPKMPDIYNNLGAALRATGKLHAAIAFYQRGLLLLPDHPNIHSNIGNAYRERGKLQLSIASHQRAIELDPKNPEAHYHLGLAFRDSGEAPKSLAAFETALQLEPTHPECRWDRALILMTLGDFKRGLDDFEWRLKLDKNPQRSFDKPIWNGSELKGKTLLIHQEQGIGNMIQFARYIQMVKERGATVIVETPTELARLMSTVSGVDDVIISGSDLPEYDCYIPILSLARIFATTPTTIPSSIPYLAPPPEASIQLPVPLDNQLRIGIAWAGNPAHTNDKNRSCDFKHFIELLGTPNISVYSLQKGVNEIDIKGNGCEALITNMTDKLGDFADTAALIQQLDLVISVDTATAHLAGALGKPVWVILPFSADWRWQHGTSDTPWYPTMRLFRQHQPADWSQVFIEIHAALGEEMELLDAEPTDTEF